MGHAIPHSYWQLDGQSPTQRRTFDFWPFPLIGNGLGHDSQRGTLGVRVGENSPAREKVVSLLNSGAEENPGMDTFVYSGRTYRKHPALSNECFGRRRQWLAKLRAEPCSGTNHE